MKTIGFVHSGSKSSFVPHFAAIDTGLGVMGYKKDVDYKIIPHWADDNDAKLRQHTKDLVNNAAIDVVIAAGGPIPAVVAKEETANQTDKKSVVFTTVLDPPSLGLVGGNLTGMAGKTSELDGKRLECMMELLSAQGPAVPRRKVNAMFKTGRPQLAAHKNALKNKATGLGADFEGEDVADDAGLDDAFDKRMAGAQGLIVTADSFFNNKREKVVKKAEQRRIPAIYQWREFVEIGGLMSYGPSIIEAYVFAGAYAARILKGEKPAQMPLSEPTHYELVINRKTAAELGLTIPQSLKDRAEMID
jgi:putative ABC transport system substrate-binding protein